MVNQEFQAFSQLLLQAISGFPCGQLIYVNVQYKHYVFPSQELLASDLGNWHAFCRHILVLSSFFAQGIDMNLSLWQILAGENNLFSVIYWWQGWICGGSGREHWIKGYFLQLNECPGLLRRSQEVRHVFVMYPLRLALWKGTDVLQFPAGLLGQRSCCRNSIM